MRSILIILIILLSSFNLFCQSESTKPAYQFGIIQKDTIRYHRKSGIFNGKELKDTSIVTLGKNELVKIIEVNNKNNEAIFETWLIDYQNPRENIKNVFHDTVITKLDNLLIFDTIQKPDKYFNILLKDYYKGEVNPSTIYAIDYNSSSGIYRISFGSYGIFEGIELTELYKVINDTPILYINALITDCDIDIYKNLVLLYNKHKVQLFDTMDLHYYPEMHLYKYKNEDVYSSTLEPKSELSVEQGDATNRIYYDKQKHEFITKNKRLGGDYYYETYKVGDGKFIKL